MTKCCRDCGVTKDLSEFYKEQGICKPCFKEANKRWCENNRERSRAIKTNWRKNNSERVAEVQKRYYDTHRDHVRDYHRLYMAKKALECPKHILTMKAHKNIGRALEHIKKDELGVSSKLELLG